MHSGTHIAVMPDEVATGLRVIPGGRYCDCTLGAGGHSAQLLELSAPDGVVVGLDRDQEAVQRAAQRLAPFGSRLVALQANFADVVQVLEERGLRPVDGLLVDLGISSHQLDDPRRGFGFAHDGPLDMRMNAAEGVTAATLIESSSEAVLAGLIRDYGEEPASRRIARAIKRAQREGSLHGTADLAQVVARCVGHRGPRRGSRIHPATRTFMALRMAVNGELESLERFLSSFTEVLRPGGRVAIISFHSLEDRAVKRGFARLANPCTCPPRLPVCVCGARPLVNVITRRPLRPAAAEQRDNPRSRSARLRIAERV